MAGFRGTTLVGRGVAWRTASEAQQPVHLWRTSHSLPTLTAITGGPGSRLPLSGSPAHLPGEFSVRPAFHSRRVAVSQRLLLLFVAVHSWSPSFRRAQGTEESSMPLSSCATADENLGGS